MQDVQKCLAFCVLDKHCLHISLLVQTCVLMILNSAERSTLYAATYLESIDRLVHG